MQKYIRLYLKLLSITIKKMLEYRFNLVINSVYVLVYSLGLYSMVEIIYSKTDHLMSFNKSELLILLGLMFVYWTIMNLFYFEGFKYFMLSDVKTGQFDFALLRPIDSQFLVATSHPMIESGFQLIIALGFTAWRISLQPEYLGILNIGVFCLAWLLSNFVVYNVVAIHATTAFFTSQSVQLLRFTQTLNDHAQFPTSLYPKSLQALLTVIFPVAFMAYIPSLFLFGKATWLTAVGLLGAVIVTTVLNKICWQYGLRHYSSASS
jgi:ABC-2 type transport system permease protein